MAQNHAALQYLAAVQSREITFSSAPGPMPTRIVSPCAISTLPPAAPGLSLRSLLALTVKCLRCLRAA